MLFSLIYSVLGSFLSCGFLFIQDSLEGNGRSNNITYCIIAFFTAALFFFISIEIKETIDIVLLSLLSICFHFLILNNIRCSRYLEALMFWLVVATTIFISLHHMSDGNYTLFLFSPLLIFAGVTIVKYMARAFISSDVIEWREVALISICSMLVINIEGLRLVSYVILIAFFYLAWAVFCRFVNKREWISLIPAIECSVMTCILSEKSAMLVQNFIQ